MEKELGLKPKDRWNNKILVVGFVLYFFLEIYDGFLGIGGGILVAYLFVMIFGFTYTPPMRLIKSLSF